MKYHDEDERKIRLEGQVRDWTRSGLLTQEQLGRILPELAVDLRRTNLVLRFVLLGFGLLIIAASVLFVAITLDLANEEGTMAMLCVIAALQCYGAAEFLITRFRLYRFGVEESAAVASAFLIGFACVIGLDFLDALGASQRAELVALLAGGAVAFGIYLRFGYWYAAIGAMYCFSMSPFFTTASEGVQRAVSADILAVAFALFRLKRREHGDEFPGDGYGVLQAITWAGIYLVLNLRMFELDGTFRPATVSTTMYWVTYALIWILPAIGLYLAFRDRDRPFLATNLILALITIMTNKPYLGAVRQTWDPILFGVFLIGLAVFVRRWLDSGQNQSRHGFTANRILNSDKEKLEVVSTASAAFHPAPQTTPGTPPPETFEGGGGRSGGAGATGSF